MTGTRIGYSLGPLLSASDLLKCAMMADSANADSIWVPESWGRESFGTLGALSQVTKAVKLGTSIMSIYSRTPATVAMGAVTIDSLSRGRMVIGLGASTAEIVEGWHGISFERPLERMREYILCLRKMLSGEKVNHDGTFFKIRNFRILEKPVRPTIPIYVAAINTRMVSLASELADGVLFYLRPVHELASAVEKVRSLRKNDDFEIALSIICAASDTRPDEARRRARKTLAFYIGAGRFYSKFLAETGYRAEVEAIQNAFTVSGSDAAAKHVPDKMLDSLAVSGSFEQCREQLNCLAQTGITRAILQVNPIDDAESSFRELIDCFEWRA